MVDLKDVLVVMLCFWVLLYCKIRLNGVDIVLFGVCFLFFVFVMFVVVIKCIRFDLNDVLIRIGVMYVIIY